MHDMQFRRLAAGLAAIMACAACTSVPVGNSDQPGSARMGGPQKGQMQMTDQTRTPGDVVSGEGRLVAGVECPVIRTQDGGLYAIAGGIARGDLPPFETRVRFGGTVLDSSFCMQGTPLQIDRLESLAE